jgi:subtilisin family serine protease
MAVLLTTVGFTSVFAADHPKLDLAARAAIYHLSQGGKSAAELRNEGLMSVTESGELDCFIVGDVSRAELEAAGARIRSALPGGIFTAFIPIENVDAVVALAGVQKIEGAQIQEAEHNNSVPTTNAHLFRGAGPTFTGLNGAGVIVGNIDTGVDYDHDDFKDAGGLTRFLKIWDQTDPIGPPAAGFGYGSDWTAADINNLTSRAKDTNGHGTHTLGTAGGDGSSTPGGTAAPAFTYAGMAPMADLIAVDASTTGSFSNTAMLDGINYIFQQATAFGKHAVANLSIGGSFGPHDGSSTFEVAVDGLTGPGRAVVFSSGNNRGDPQHAETFASALGADITMSVSAANVTGRRVQLNGWYNSTETIDVTVITPNGTVIGPIAFGGQNAAFPGTPTANGAVYVENGFGAGGVSTNGSRLVLIDFQNQNSGTQNPNGTWTFRFTLVAAGAANGEVDLWRHFRSSTAIVANFVTGLDATTEYVNGIGTGQNVITVAAWQTRQNWTDCRAAMWNSPANATFGGPPVGNLATFSSMGPTRDGRIKPEITAPGAEIISALTTDAGAIVCPAGPNTFVPGLRHWVNRGTSMAAPHVTGAIGLLFQKFGALTPAQLRTFLQNRAVVDAFTGGAPNDDWGYGKLFLGDLSDPLCTVVSPNGGEVVFIGNTIPLQWTASDAYQGVTGVDLELSRTGVGGPYTTIATNVPNTGSYNWNVTGPATNNAFLRVTAKDAATNAGVDVSDAQWSIEDQPVPTTMAMFRADPTPEGVRLVWQFTDPSQFSSVAVERATRATGPWSELDAELSADGAATVALDRSVETGETYYYRLAATYGNGVRATFGPLSATAGERIAEFGLRGIAPNPTSGPTMVEFAMPRAADIKVAVYDLQGRELATLARGVHPAGRHQVTWTGEVDGGPARAGIYFLLMKAPGFSQSRRIVVSN